MRSITRKLLEQAARLRNEGKTWNEVGGQLGRKGKSCQQWTMRYSKLWTDLVQQSRQRIETTEETNYF